MSALTPEQSAALEAAARDELWRRGDLSFIRYAHQQAVADRIAAPDVRDHYSLWTRRGTKSGNGVLTCLEACIRKEGGRALFLAPTAKSAAQIAGDIAGKLLRTCPDDTRPEYRMVDKEFVWKDRDSVWRLKGVNGESYEDLRGGEYDVVVLDECAQYDQLEEIIFGVVLPMTLTTKGRILYQTTPPRSPAHYSVKLFRDMEERGATSLITLRDVTHIDHEEKCRMLVAVGEKPERVEDILAGRAEPETNYAKREFFCQFVVDENLAVVPEFSAHRKTVVVPKYERPPYFDAYGAADMGMRDRTGILSAYLDFREQTLVVEAASLLDRANTAQVANAWRKQEEDLGYQGHVLLRVADDPSLRVSADLTSLGVRCQPVQKPGREAAVAAMRVAISSGRLRILEEACAPLIRQLETAIYKSAERGNDFARDQEGHFDLVDALVYLVRSVIWSRNPYPADWDWRKDLHTYAGGTAVWRPPPTSRSSLNQGVFGSTPAGRRLLKRGQR